MGLFNKKESKKTARRTDSRRTLHENLEFTATEQYKLLRTNLKFTLPPNVTCPIIGVTSSVRGEGKSTTAINLSYMLAENESRVLLIDGDLRLPSVAKKMGVDGSRGLTNLLVGEELNMREFRSELQKNWYVLPSGTIPPNPSELLGSYRMAALLEKLQAQFDYIVIDLPPVNIVSDAASVANFITGMIVVVREDYTEKQELERCIRQLKLSHTNILGYVMNETGKGGDSYRKYKKYRYYK